MNQARTILDRRNLNFKNVTYADIIRNEARNTVDINSGSNRIDGETDKSNQAQPERSEKGKINESEVQVVCRSSNSGNLFTTVADLSAEVQATANRDDCTSEISASVRAEVRNIFESQYEQQEASADENRRRYESDVRQAMRNQRGANTEPERNED